jgi:hypothetical protein
MLRKLLEPIANGLERWYEENNTAVEAVSASVQEKCAQVEEVTASTKSLIDVVEDDVSRKDSFHE